ncbi:peptidylprolyl isomerase [Thermodesulfobacteriota bacterium]
MMTSRPNILIVGIFLLVIFTASNVSGSNIRMVTNMGDIDVELFDAVTPITVANFLKYINDGDYINTFIHRSVTGFVIQGGGFTINGSNILTIPTDPPIANEYSLSNLRGTIAMAKLSGDPDSATSQWFFNLADNSSILDGQNGGFTVFGQVVESSLDVIDAIASLPVYDASSLLGPTFAELPLLDNALTADNLVTISDIIVFPDFQIGNVDGNGKLDIADAILVLQALTGTTQSVKIFPEADVNGNEAIGLDEAIYVLQIVAGVRSE